MKNILFLLFSVPLILLANKTSWSYTSSPEKVIIKNEGQFSSTGISVPIEYAYDGRHQYYFFTKSGVTFEFQNKTKPVKSAEEKAWRTERKKEGLQKSNLTILKELDTE